MKKATDILNRIVFLTITIMIIGVFSEGMSLKWYTIVGVMITIVDYLIMFAAVIKLITERKTKWRFINIICAGCIALLFVLSCLSVTYPVGIHVAGYISIWIIYGIQVLDQIKEEA